MNDMKSRSPMEILRQADDGSGRPRLHLYEIYERAGKALPRPAYGWGYGETLYDASPDQEASVHRMLEDGVLNRTSDEYVYFFHSRVRKLELKQG